MEKPINLKIGSLGEDIAVKYLINKGFSIILRNYREKWGEIDIICVKNGVTHFVEVKSVSRITPEDHGSNDLHRPEDNLHGNKAKRLRRVIETYLASNITDNDFVCDLITVKIDSSSKIAKVSHIQDIIL